MKKIKSISIKVQGTPVSILSDKEGDYISLTDMIRAKDGDFFISDWLRNRNTVEFLGIWEGVYNPYFNYGEFAIIKSQAGLNSYKLSVKEWVEKTNAINNQISWIDGRLLARSLRRLLAGEPEEKQIRQLRYSVQLPDQAILDLAQDEIFRLPPRARIRISGAPG